MNEQDRLLDFGPFRVDLDQRMLMRGEEIIALQPKAFETLLVLLRNSERVVPKDDLMKSVWPDSFVEESNLSQQIFQLRRALGQTTQDQQYIVTVPGRGYRLAQQVRKVPCRDIDATGAVSAVASSRPSNSEKRAPLSWRLIVICAVSSMVVAGMLLVRWYRLPRVAPQKRVMLAILPFQNLSNDAAQEYFSDGLTEETITDLGQLSPEQLGVIARTSAMSYKHTQKTVTQIGQELGVDYILEGSVRREGAKARVSAQLIRVSDQTHLWATSYDRELKSVLEIESELGRTIAQQVQVNLTPQRQLALSKLRTVDPEAYDLYLKGRYYWNERTPPGIKQSIGYFNQAIAKDPNFALAYAGLADSYNISNIVGALSPRESLPLARAAAERAIELDSSLAEAHAALGMEKSHYDFDFPGAQREFLKAIDLNRNSAYAHFFYSNCYLMPMGRVQEAITENKKAVELDPLSLPINNFMAMSYSFAGDYQNAYKQYQHTIEMDPTFPLAHDYLSGLYLVTNRYEDAIQEEEKADLLRGIGPQAASARAAASLQAFKSGGVKAFWRWNVENVMASSKRPDGSVWAGGMSMAYAMAGDKDKAFEWLNIAYEQREGQDITLLKVDPMWKNLHGDPRFTALLKRMGLPEEEIQLIHTAN